MLQQNFAFIPQAYLEAVSQFEKQHQPIDILFNEFHTNLVARSPMLVPLSAVYSYANTKMVLTQYLLYTRDPNQAFTAIDEQWLEKFRNYIIYSRGNKIGTAYIHCMHIRKFVQHAIDHKWTKIDTVCKFKTTKERNELPYLTLAEVQQIAATVVNKEYLQLVQQLFLVQCYTGLAYVDLVALQAESFKTDGTKRWLELDRIKTGTRCIIPLLPQALMAIEKAKTFSLKYKTRKQTGILPVHDNCNYNNYVKELARLCNIEKSISSHTGRRTFASSISYVHGASYRTIGKMLGHARTTETGHYAVVTDEKISREMKLLKGL